jgi:hypothetical protein
MQNSNIITPPDFIESNAHTVLLIDPTQIEVEAIALYCSGTDESFNIYVYLSQMNDTEWLSSAMHKSMAIIVNTTESDLSKVKDKIATMAKSYYYGPKNFLINSKRVNSPLEYFTSIKAI